MHGSQSRKIIAARKRLKEFQLNKKLHGQDGSVKQQNDATKVPQTQSEDTVIQKSQRQNDSEQKSQILTVPADNQNVHIKTESATELTNTEIQVNNVTESAIIANESKTLNNHVLEQESLANSNSTVECHPHVNNVDPIHTQPEKISQNTEDQYDYSSVSLHESAIAQKEHLLHMASAVSNALAETGNENESKVLDSGAKSLDDFLNSFMEEQKTTVNQLHVQVAQYSSRIGVLEAMLATKEAEFETRLAREVGPLKEQLQIHTQTTGILIAEKAELSGALTQCQLTAKHNVQEIEELSGKLKNSQTRINDLEKELALSRNNNEEARKVAERIQREYTTLNEKYLELRKEKEDLDLGISEVKQKLNVKNAELTNLQQELHEKTALLSLNELRIQQLTNTAQEVQVLEGQHHTVVALEQQLAQMREALKTMSHEKDEASKQYQNYVRQLDVQQSKLINELENEKTMIKELEKKEQSYIDRLSDLERQLQTEKNRVETLVPLQDQKDRIDTLTRNIDELTLEHERLLIELSKKDNDVKALTAELEEYRNASEETVEASKLAQALESEQLGASRAVSQNQRLKQELTEMHDAFVSLSNSKLDLTEQLQAERSIGRKLNAQLNIIENEMKELSEQLKQKEAQVVELEKERLHTAQITDQMQHYQVQFHQTSTLQQELQNALAYIERLKKENSQLIEQLKANVELQKQEHQEVGDSVDSVNASHDNEPGSAETTHTNEETITKPLEEQKELRTEATQTSSELSEPIKKLEQRFKETMEKVAELTDEKQRLEHLILQLQSETETIGEYITLYQRQRAVLQERSKEKDQAFRQLLTQRNQQQEQLHKLKVLITDLMTKNPNIRQHNLESPVSNNTVPDNIISPKSNDETDRTETTKLIEDETTSQILDVLSEIKDCNKDNCILEPNLHLCPWCSGELISV